MAETANQNIETLAHALDVFTIRSGRVDELRVKPSCVWCVTFFKLFAYSFCNVCLGVCTFYT